MGIDDVTEVADYTLQDVDDAEARIRRECPAALISRGDYDWSLSVAKADKSVAYWVFRPSILERMQGGVVGDLEKIIALLNS